MSKKAEELIPPPDFKRTHVTNYVLEQDRKALARIEQSRKMREDMKVLRTKEVSDVLESQSDPF